MPSLEHAMRTVLAQMTLIQYGKTAALNASGGRSENPDPRPAGESHPLAEKWRDEWAKYPTEDTLLMARAELDAWKRGVPPDPGLEWDESAWMVERVIEKGEGFSAEQVARSVNCTPSMVRRLRLKHDRESEFGLSTQFPTERAPDARERVANLTAQGCTLRQIEMQTGVKRETVRRWMKEAA